MIRPSLTSLLLAAVVLLPISASAQLPEPSAPLVNGIDPAPALDALRQDPGRDLTVLAPTLPPEEIDRAVLNRLMQEIATDPDATRVQLGVSREQLDDIFITISNARSFINGNDMAAIRAMCRRWNSSSLQGDARIEQALDAYKRRASFTSRFIARYYQMVLFDIESNLSAAAKNDFRRYMDDRRRRMANAGNITFGAVVENVTSGAESVQFHCRRETPRRSP